MMMMMMKSIIKLLFNILALNLFTGTVTNYGVEYNTYK